MTNKQALEILTIWMGQHPYCNIPSRDLKGAIGLAIVALTSQLQQAPKV